MSFAGVPSHSPESGIYCQRFSVLGLMTMVGPKLVQPSSVRPFLNRFAISRGAHNFWI
ncbi:hypothetical protein LINGRAHAP2_LOCUS23158 [Linum grandiflorum]